MAITGFEIDFLPVGFQPVDFQSSVIRNYPKEEFERSGDAIFFRYRENGDERVILIDGGWHSSEIFCHMRKYYYPKADSYKDMRIDHIICSHPDADHVGGRKANGLVRIMDECTIGTLWVNNPNQYPLKLRDFVDSDSKEKRLNLFSQENAVNASCLIEAAKRNKIEVKKPLQGALIGPLIVASPSEEFYRKLVNGEFKKQENCEKARPEYLKYYPRTSVCNESSTVLFGKLMGKQLLLTADAGIEALSKAYDYLKEEHNFQPGDLDLMQIPHHGNLNNVNVITLRKLLGGQISNEERGTAVESIAKNTEYNYVEVVKRAFKARGYSCESTAGTLRWFKCGDMPERDDCCPIPWVERSSPS